MKELITDYLSEKLLDDNIVLDKITHFDEISDSVKIFVEYSYYHRGMEIIHNSYVMISMLELLGFMYKNKII